MIPTVTRFLRITSLFVSLFAASAFAQTATKPYRVGVVPQFTALQIDAAWTPFLAVLAKSSGLAFELSIPASIPALEQQFTAGAYDFAYMNPYHAVMANRAQKYLPLARGDRDKLFGILVVAADSPYRTPADLHGKTIAFPAPNAFGASLYLRSLLAEKFKLQFTPVYVKTHSNTYRAVGLGDAAAGGGLESTLAREPDALRKSLRVLYRTPDSAPHPLAAHPRVAPEHRERIVKAVLAMKATDAGRKLLEDVGLADPVRADYKRDYAPLEALGIERYVVAN